jgi:two-component system, OmpR family, sensor histidine kinase KdpD
LARTLDRYRKLRRISDVQALNTPWRYAIGLLAVGLLTVCGLLLHFNLSTVTPLYFLAVVLVALHWGFWPATIVSLAALFFQLYIFAPPEFSFHVTDRQNLVALFVFEASALVVSRLSAREQRHGREAREQRASAEKLYELSRQTLTLDLHQEPGNQLLGLIGEIFDVDALAIFDADLGTIDTSGDWPIDVGELARNTHYFEINSDDAQTGISRRVLRMANTPIGALILRGQFNPLTIDAIASLVSITLDRYRSLANETMAEAAHQSEQLRTTVLDSLAHAFKTPLTAIRTASSGMLELGGLPPAHADLAALIDEQSSLLNELATHLLRTARLEAEAVDLHRQDVPVADLIEEVVTEHAGRTEDHPLHVSISDKCLTAHADRDLLATIVRQFVDNAFKYSYPGSDITISAEESASEVLIAVHNEGPPIREQDRERIFERFYRCPETEQRVQGTGIGLCVAKKAAEAQHGHVWVTSGEAEGTTFFLSIRGAKGGRNEHSQWQNSYRR